eukprot:TCONS_00012749-protein
MADSEVLSGDFDEGSKLFKSLLVDTKSDLDKAYESYQKGPEANLVAPKPGWCIKTWKTDGEKVFMNVCTSDMVLKPKDLSEDEVRKIVESEDPTKFRIPMGIGEAHKEHENSGKEVDVYDIVIHPEFFTKCQQQSFFKEFFIMLIFDGLEAKYELNLNREYKILKNRKAMGTLQMQTVRSKSKPVIMEMDPVMAELEQEQLDEQRQKQQIMSEVSSTKYTSTHRTQQKYVEPKFTMIKEPDEGTPEFLVFEISLPKQNSSKNVILDVGEDCLILHASDGNYKMDLDLPYNVNNDETGAQFNKKTKVLTVTLPVLVNS